MLTSRNHYDFVMSVFRSTKNKSHKKQNKNMKNTHLQKHLRNQRDMNMSTSQVGPEEHPRRPKASQGCPWTPPRHPQKTSCVFGASRAPPEEPPGPPWDSPRHPQGPPRDAQNPPRALPTTSQGPPREPNRGRGPPQRPPGRPPDAQGPPGDPQHPSGTAPSIRPGGMRGAIESAASAKDAWRF